MQIIEFRSMLDSVRNKTGTLNDLRSKSHLGNPHRVDSSSYHTLEMCEPFVLEISLRSRANRFQIAIPIAKTLSRGLY